MSDREDLFKRERYLNAFKPFMNSGNVKVVTGIRRCGKTSLLETLVDSFPKDTNVIEINMELAENEDLKDWRKLLKHINSNLKKGKENVLFINEIQDIVEWESAIRDLVARGACTIYITGSNSRLLSTDYSTYLGGRYDLFHLMPLSFSECVKFQERYQGAAGSGEILDRFMRVGGFPIIWRYGMDTTTAIKTVTTLIDAAINNDIVKRFGVRNVDLLKRILKTILSSIGKFVSVSNIYNTLISGRISVSRETVYEYMGYLEAANIIIKAEVFDIRGREILKCDHKYYVTDLGIKHALLGYRQADIPAHMENIIFTELLGRGYNVYVGDADGKEVDIVARRGDEYVYVQACVALTSEETIAREFGNLERIKDNHPKYLVLMDAGIYKGITPEGIICCGLKEFLEMENYTISPF
jgi:predicted AAA+ superfamily ATPase